MSKVETLALAEPLESDQQPNAKRESHIPQPLFAMASVNPAQFVSELDWNISDNIEELFLNPAADAPSNLFNSSSWMATWCQVSSTDAARKLLIASGRLGGRTIVTLPLFLITNRLGNRLEFASQEVSDYNAPLVHEDFVSHFTIDVYQAILSHLQILVPDADCISFRKCQVNTPIDTPSKFGWKSEPDGSHASVLTGDWEYDRSTFIGKSSQRSLKRKRKKLEAFGEVKFKQAVTAEEKEQALEKLIEWKAIQLSELGSASKFEDRQFCDFLRSVVRNDQTGLVQLHTINIDDRPIASMMLLCSDSCWFLYQTSYTPEEPGKYSPGYLLLLDVMERASNASVPLFDFGWGNEAYKFRFATLHPDLYSLRIPFTNRGKVICKLAIATEMAKSFVKSNSYLRSAMSALLRLKLRILRG